MRRRPKKVSKSKNCSFVCTLNFKGNWRLSSANAETSNQNCDRNKRIRRRARLHCSSRETKSERRSLGRRRRLRSHLAGFYLISSSGIPAASALLYLHQAGEHRSRIIAQREQHKKHSGACDCRTATINALSYALHRRTRKGCNK